MLHPEKKFMEELKGKVAIVTGSSRGIGLATAELLAQKLARVVLMAETEAELKEAEQKIKQADGEVLSFSGDVSRGEDAKRIIDSVVKKFERIDILVNNAGVAVKKPLTETTFDEWQRVLEVNLTGTFLFSKYALPYIIQSRGVIINISSSAGKKGRAGYGAYSASKFGVIGFTESLAKEAADLGVRVYSVCPSGIDTKMYRDIHPEIDPKTLLPPRVVAEKILELILDGSIFPSGSSVEVGKGVRE